MKNLSLKTKNFSKIQLALFIAVFACIGAFILLQSHAATATANLWVDGGSGSCTRSASAVAYSSTTACGTISAAWAAAQGGDTIMVEGSAGGTTYGSAFSASGTKSSTVTISIPDGQSAWFAGDGSLSNVTNMTVTDNQTVNLATESGIASGLAMGFTTISGSSANLNFNNIDIWCQTQSPWHVVTGPTVAGSPTQCSAPLLITGVNGFTMTGGSQGPMADCQLSGCANRTDISKVTACSSNAACNNITFDHVLFHDNINLDGNNSGHVHNEMWKIDQGQNITFRSSKFVRCNGAGACDSAVVFLGQSGSSPTANNLSFIGDAFGPAGNASVAQGYCSPSPCSPTMNFKYNSSANSFSILSGISSYINYTFVGNAAYKANFDCSSQPGALFDHDMWYTSDAGTPAAKCSANDNPGSTNANLATWWTNYSSGDFSLPTNSPLLNVGGTGCTGLTDFAGNTRPQGSVCDAGAYEYVSGPVANLWVDGGSGSCTRSVTAASYSSTTACTSLAAAYSAAAAGDSVLVKCGTYGSQTFSGTKSGSQIVFQPENADCATLGSITTGTSGMFEIKNFVINGQVYDTSSGQSSNVTFDSNQVNVGQKVNGPSFLLHEPQNWTISNNTIGPSCCGYNGGSGNSPEGIRIGKPDTTVASCASEACNITITNNLIQYVTRNCSYWPSTGYGSCPDTTCTNAISCHIDGIHIWGVIGAQITRNRLYGAECQAIFLEPTNNSLNQNISIIGNAITGTVGGCGSPALSFNASGSNTTGGTITIAFNSTSPSDYLNYGQGFGGDQAGTVWNVSGNYANLFQSDINGNNTGCNAAPNSNTTVNYSYNAWQNNYKCSSTDASNVASPGFVNAGDPPATGLNMHLASSSGTAINFVPSAFCISNPSQCLSVDIDGTARPQGTAYDAGAYEITASGGSSGPSIGDLNSDGHVNITDLSILLSHYGQSGVTPAQGDCNSDGTVNITDLSILLSHYGK